MTSSIFTLSIQQLLQIALFKTKVVLQTGVAYAKVPFRFSIGIIHLV